MSPCLRSPHQHRDHDERRQRQRVDRPRAVAQRVGARQVLTADVPQAVPVGGSLGVEPEELPPAGGREQHEREVDDEPRRPRDPRELRPPHGPSFAEASDHERDREQYRVGLRGRSEPERHPRGGVPSLDVGERSQRCERHGQQVPVHEPVDQERGRQREEQRATPHEQVEGDGDRDRRRREDRDVRVEEPGVAPRRAGIVVGGAGRGTEPRGNAHHVHRPDRILVAVRVPDHARIEVGEPIARQ